MPPKPTHFLCLPLVTSVSLPQLTASLAKFTRDKAVQNSAPGARPSKRPPPQRKKVATDSESNSDGEDETKALPTSLQERYIPVKAIRPVGTLHLTLGVMNLNTKDKIDAASRFLRELNVKNLMYSGEGIQSVDSKQHETSETSIQDRRSAEKSLAIQLQGLSAMQQPSRTRVLYAEPVDISGQLLSFCSNVRDTFIEAGHVVDEGRELKLHATIVNTIYASKVPRGGKGKRLEFDATDLIERWKDEVWAEVELNRLAICEMGAKEDSTGMVRYVEVAGVDI